jgi:hypothetical protein
MTEGEWLGCRDWRELLDFAESHVSQRRLGLFAVACCRAVWRLLPPGSRTAVEVAERYADGKAAQEELETVRAGFRAGSGDSVEVINGVRYRPDFGGAADENAAWAAKAGMRGRPMRPLGPPAGRVGKSRATDSTTSYSVRWPPGGYSSGTE